MSNLEVRLKNLKKTKNNPFGTTFGNTRHQTQQIRITFLVWLVHNLKHQIWSMIRKTILSSTSWTSKSTNSLTLLRWVAMVRMVLSLTFATICAAVGVSVSEISSMVKDLAVGLWPVIFITTAMKSSLENLCSANSSWNKTLRVSNCLYQHRKAKINLSLTACFSLQLMATKSR